MWVGLLLKILLSIVGMLLGIFDVWLSSWCSVMWFVCGSIFGSSLLIVLFSCRWFLLMSWSVMMVMKDLVMLLICMWLCVCIG